VEEVHYWRGNALAMTNELRGAQEAYQEALRVNPNFYYAEWALDDVNSRLGDG
jgi:tetratricopeptide (TPR) repeat protein